VEKFAEVRLRFDKEAADSSDRERLQAFVLRWTGRKAGVLTQITDNWLKPATPELKRIVGQELNKLKAHVEKTLEEKRKEIEAASEQTVTARDKIDLSLPGIERAFGTRHLIRQTFEELQRIFTAIGFSVVEGPEIETPYYNFEALNIPEHHPARDNMDTVCSCLFASAATCSILRLSYWFQLHDRIGPVIINGATYLVWAYLAGATFGIAHVAQRFVVARYLDIPAIASAGELSGRSSQAELDVEAAP